MLTALISVLVVLLLVVVAIWLVGERGHIVLPSTRRMMGVRPHRDATPPTPQRQRQRESKFVRVRDAFEGYVYGRWTNQYLSVLIHRIAPQLGPAGKKWLSDHYHGKILTHDEARAIITLNTPIKRDLEQIVPYPMARDFILNASPMVAAYECSCRHARPNPCQPTQVCMVVGEAPANFILEHNPQSSRRLTQNEALELLRAEHERGHIHSAWFKTALGGRFYAICNCCQCCCGGIEAMKKYSIPMVASSGYVAAIDSDLCNACGNCAPFCAFDALAVEDSASRDWEKCMGCGVCVDQCPTGALSLVRDERKGIPLDVRAMA